ncbi:hypothetical protein VUR80DRAFT_7572 [Thermomyces stellatus]
MKYARRCEQQDALAADAERTAVELDQLHYWPDIDVPVLRHREAALLRDAVHPHTFQPSPAIRASQNRSTVAPEGTVLAQDTAFLYEVQADAGASAIHRPDTPAPFARACIPTFCTLRVPALRQQHSSRSAATAGTSFRGKRFPRRASSQSLGVVAASPAQVRGPMVETAEEARVDDSRRH